jgi:hypothetical protein
MATTLPRVKAATTDGFRLNLTTPTLGRISLSCDEAMAIVVATVEAFEDYAASKKAGSATVAASVVRIAPFTTMELSTPLPKAFTTSTTPRRTFIGVAREVLKAAGVALSVREIWNAAVAAGLTADLTVSKTPKDTLRARLSTAAKDSKSGILREGPKFAVKL